MKGRRYNGSAKAGALKGRRYNGRKKSKETAESAAGAKR